MRRSGNGIRDCGLQEKLHILFLPAGGQVSDRLLQQVLAGYKFAGGLRAQLTDSSHDDGELASA